MQDYEKIRKMVHSDNANERFQAIIQIQFHLWKFTDTDKEQVWKDLLTLTKDKDCSVRDNAASVLSQAIQYVKNKEQATKDLLELTKDKDIEVRWRAASALGPAFQHIKDKKQAWNDLLGLINDKDFKLRLGAASALGMAFQYITDKEQATKDLQDMAKDKDSNVRWGAAYALGLAFRYITDKEQATEYLLELSKDKDSNVRKNAAKALGLVFEYIVDKEQATKDLLGLTKDKESIVRWYAASALGMAFQYITDKEQATKDLLELTKDKESIVRWPAASALGLAFQYITDKEQVTKDLLVLVKDKDNNVRVSANYSLGKMSIYRATEVENEERFKEEMEKAIGFFENSSQDTDFFSNPAKFCLPFYRSYNAVISGHEGAKEEIENNLRQAKWFVNGSESKEQLLEAVENLANALEEVQNLRGLDEIQADLNAFRRYCDRAVELLDVTEDAAPGATKLVRRGLPIIDEQIKEIIAEIQEKTKALCIETKDSPFEDIGKEVNKIGQNLLLIRDPIGLEKSVNNLEIVLSDICNRMAGIEKGEACELLEREKNEQYIEDKLPLMSLILSKVTSQIDTQKYGIREELVISVGGTIFGTGAQHNITIPLQEIAYDDLKNDLKKIGNKNVFDLATLPPKLAEKVNQYIDKIKGKK